MLGENIGQLGIFSKFQYPAGLFHGAVGYCEMVS